MRVFDVEYILRVEIEVFPLFIAQVSVGVPIANDFARVLDTDGPVVCCQHDAHLLLRQIFNHIEQRRVFKP